MKRRSRWLVVALVLGGLVLLVPKRAVAAVVNPLRWPRRDDFDAEIAQAHGAFPTVPTAIIKAVIARESGFAPDAIRGEPQDADASRGLMQLLYRTAQSVGYGGTADKLLLPAVNVYYGTRYLASLYAHLGSWPATFSAYNGGMRPALGFGARAVTAVRVCLAHDPATGECAEWHDTPPGEFSNQGYVDRVLANAAYFGATPDQLA